MDNGDIDRGDEGGYDEFVSAMRSSSRRRTPSTSEDGGGTGTDGIKNIHMVERDNRMKSNDIDRGASASVHDAYSAASASQYTHRSQYRNGASLPVRRRSSDDYDDDDDNDDTFHSVSRSGRVDTGRLVAASASNRAQSNVNGRVSDPYPLPEQKQHHSQQQQQLQQRPTQRRPSPPSSRSREPPPNDRGRSIAGSNGINSQFSGDDDERSYIQRVQSYNSGNAGNSREMSGAERIAIVDGRSQSRGLPESRSRSRVPPLLNYGQDHQGHQPQDRRRLSPSQSGGGSSRPPPRDPSPPRQNPSDERLHLTRTPSRRGENVPLDRPQSSRSSAGIRRENGGSPKSVKQSQKIVNGRHIEKVTPSHTSSKIEDERQTQHYGGQQHNHNDTIDDSRSMAKSKSSSSTKSSKKHASSKITVVSSRTHSTWGTPETGALTSSSGKSSKGNFLKSHMPNMHGRMPPSTPPEELDDSDSRPATPNRVPRVHDDSTNKGMGVDDEEIVTNLFDRKGYCIRHPTVQLRKKKIFGGWNILMTNCPDCCMEEMHRLKRVSKRNKAASRANDIRRKSEKKSSKSKNKTPGDVPNLEQRERNSGRTVGRDRSPSRQRKKNSAATDTKRSARISRSRSKNRHDHRNTSSIAAINNTSVFEFDIPHDVYSEITSARSSALDKKKSHESYTSKKSKSARTERSAKTVRSKMSGKTSRTHRSGNSKRTGQHSRSMQGEGSSIKQQTTTTSSSRGRSSSNKRESRGRSSSNRRNRSKSRAGKSRSVSRELRPRSSQRGKSKSARLLVAKMPYHDQYNREGSYTGEINEFGQPNGRGTLTFNNGMVFEGKWKDGNCKDLEGIKMNTSATPAKGENGQQHGRVSDLKWSDVNGFSGTYTGEVNSLGIPDGHGLMRYTNGVVEEGMFYNGVYQPPTTGPSITNGYGGIPCGDGRRAPSSSMSVWSLKSSPTMSFVQGGPGVLAGKFSTGVGAPTSVHLGPGGHINH